MTKRTQTLFLVVHCSATRASDDKVNVDTIRKWHKAKGWADVGYHFVIRRDGVLERGRKMSDVGAHVQGYNLISLGICLVGGVAEDGKTPQDNFTPEQWKTLHGLLRWLRNYYPHAKVLGHRDLSPDRNRDGKITPDEWLKACPCFDVTAWLKRNPLDKELP